MPMTDSLLSLARERARILREMGEIPLLIRGTLSVQTYQAKGRAQGPYYLLQRWEQGQHKCQRVSPEQLPLIQQGLEGSARFNELAEQYLRLAEAQTWAAQPADLKKKFQKFWRPISPTPGPASSESTNK